jgi:hypothetical protein
MRKILRWGALPLLVLFAAACGDENSVTSPELESGTLSTSQHVTEVGADAVTTETLLAGQDIPVGEVSVTHHTDETVTVTYEMLAGFCLTETHWEANYEVDNLTNAGGNPQIGQFAFGDDDLDCVSEYTETGDILGTPDGDYIVAAHAVVEGADSGENPHVVFGTYDAPGDGTEEGDIYGVNPTTGALSLVADISNDGTGDPFDPNGLAIDRGTEELFYVSELDLFVLPADGSAAPTLVASGLTAASGEGTIRNATVADGFYYYVPNGTDELWRIGTDGSNNAQYCDLNAPGDGELYFGDIAASLDDNTIYGTARIDDPTVGDVQFFAIDVDGVDDCSSTNSATFIDPASYDFQLQVAFGADGTLYGQQAVSEPSSDLPGQWFELDTGTGEITATLAQTERSFTDIAGGLPFEPVEFDETAWAEGDRFTQRGSWAMFMGPFSQVD